MAIITSIDTYQNFKDKVDAALTTLSTNYVNTTCDLDALLELVYFEIIEEVNLEWAHYEHVVTSRDIQLDTSFATGLYSRVNDIYDEDRKSIMKYFQHISSTKYRFLSDVMFEHYEGQTIYFIRAVQKDLESLSSSTYLLIYSTVLSGIMYYIQSDIPSQLDAAISNNGFQKYERAKEKLKNSLPQVEYIGDTYANSI